MNTSFMQEHACIPTYLVQSETEQTLTSVWVCASVRINVIHLYKCKFRGYMADMFTGSGLIVIARECACLYAYVCVDFQDFMSK